MEVPNPSTPTLLSSSRLLSRPTMISSTEASSSSLGSLLPFQKPRQPPRPPLPKERSHLRQAMAAPSRLCQGWNWKPFLVMNLRDRTARTRLSMRRIMRHLIFGKSARTKSIREISTWRTPTRRRPSESPAPRASPRLMIAAGTGMQIDGLLRYGVAHGDERKTVLWQV